jgi:hypothetical protein
MAVSAPEWLVRHGGEIRRSVASDTYLICFACEPQYLLSPVPVNGKIGCRITQSINGKRIASSETAATEEAAVAQGLDDLRKALGW